MKFGIRRALIILAVLFGILSLPSIFVESVRVKVASLFSFFWKTSSRISNSKESSLSVLNKQLESENLLLKKELIKLQSLVEFNQEVKKLSKEKSHYEQLNMARRASESGFLESLYLKALPAQIIFRDPTQWMSCCWISVGEKTNERLGKKIVSKNSPVVLGRSVIGVIDQVGARHSRVRFLTDLGLKPSVRAVRGSLQQQLFLEHVEALMRSLKCHVELSLSNEEKTHLMTLLDEIHPHLLQQNKHLYLAKGIVHGRSFPLWKGGGYLLRGMGFNYDFSDEEGPARDLFSGALQEGVVSLSQPPLLREGDLLLTTGMDGVFPAGLRVGEVLKVCPLKEGAFSYDLLALPAAGSFDELQTVYVLPSLEFEAKKE